jgi:hypothetical protein
MNTATKKHENRAVAIGTFSRVGEARDAIETLRKNGFQDGDIGILTHDKEGDPDVKSLKDLSGTKSGTGAAVGVAAGAGGGALWALGIAAGILPAIGPVIAGGVLAAIAASAATGAAAGGIVGALVGMGVSDEEAAYYEDELRQGKTLVVVNSPERAAEAYRLFKQHQSTNRYANSYL